MAILRLQLIVFATFWATVIGFGAQCPSSHPYHDSCDYCENCCCVSGNGICCQNGPLGQCCIPPPGPTTSAPPQNPGPCYNPYCNCSHGTTGGSLTRCSAYTYPTLDLRSNGLTSINDTIFGRGEAPNLLTIYLNDNALTYINSVAFNGLSTLAFLYLSSNQFEVINPELFTSIPSLNYLFLQDNPWNCSNCFVQKMSQLAAYEKTKDNNPAYCSVPNVNYEISTYTGNCT